MDSKVWLAKILKATTVNFAKVRWQLYPPCWPACCWAPAGRRRGRGRRAADSPQPGHCELHQHQHRLQTREVSFQSYLFINFTLWPQNTTTQNYSSNNLLLRHPLYSPIWFALLWEMVRRRIANRRKAMFTGCFVSVKSVDFWLWP